MIIAVTGANGFIGEHLCRRVAAAGHEVRRIVRADFPPQRLLDRMSGVDVVVHLAGATRAPTLDRLRRANVGLTENVLAAARTAGVRRLVFVSSQAAAGPAVSLDKPVTEDDTPAPVEAYGRTKLEAERIVEGSGLEFVTVRPSAVYGSGDRDFLAMFRLARWRMAIHPGNREQWISIIHVDDCADGMIAAATHTEAAGRTYFLANDEPVQWRELFRLAAEAYGRTLLADVEVPSKLVSAGAKLGDVFARITGRAGLLTSEKVALARAPFWICSSARAKSELGFLPRVELRAGLKATTSSGRPVPT